MLRRVRDRIRAFAVRILVGGAVAGFFLHGGRMAARDLAPAAASTDDRQAGTLSNSRQKESSGAAQGGGQQADFDSLIELIQSTIAPDTWEDVGGAGTIAGFPGGVFVDPAGVLRSVDRPLQEELTTIWNATEAYSSDDDGEGRLRASSPMRKVSLQRLQRRMEHLRQRGEDLPVEMRFLAGLQRVDGFLLDSETGDCILVGPAAAWTLDGQGRVVGSDTGRPVCRLDDLIVLLRNSLAGQGQFLCAITPRPENLRRTQEFLEASAKRPVPPGERDAWLGEFRDALGKQQIEVQGVDPDTRVARVLVEADHHMKLVGLGLVPAAGDLVDYLAALSESVGTGPVELGVLRWWFTLQEGCVRRSANNSAYVLQDRVVCLLSENELLARHGQRVPTGRADPINAQFARRFTANYRALSQQYPVYAELDNLFRLAIVGAVLREEDLLGGVDGSLESWLDDRSYRIPRARTPREVLSVVNYLELNRRHFLAAVSGGVSFRREQLLARGFDTTPIEADRTVRRLQAALPDATDAWWWD